MPINKNPKTKVQLICDTCHGEAYFELSNGHDANCGTCQGKGSFEMSVEEWIKKNVKDKSNEPGTYTFDDMVKAFRLGVLAESGQFPYKDYMSSEDIIKKYFQELEPGFALVK